MFPQGHASERLPAPSRSTDSAMPPGRLFGTLRSRSAQQPELRLALAVLEDAVRCLNGNRDPWKIPPRLFRWEAERWIESRDRKPLFSFESICSILHLDAKRLRERIRHGDVLDDEEHRQEV